MSILSRTFPYTSKLTTVSSSSTTAVATVIRPLSTLITKNNTLGNGSSVHSTLPSNNIRLSNYTPVRYNHEKSSPHLHTVHSHHAKTNPAAATNPAATSTTTPAAAHGPDGHHHDGELGAKGQEDIIKDAKILFEIIWKDVVASKGVTNMNFPAQIVWMTGAPGAGKGTMASLVMKERDITQAFEVSSLLNSPAFRELKQQGVLISDRDVIQAVIVELIKPEYMHGVIVDGFPRTTLQAHCIRFLRDKIQELWTEYRSHPELRKVMRRPNFSIACFYCSEEESIKRQLQRGHELSRLNRMVNETGVGNVADVRATDVSPEAARKRYRIFKEEVYGSLQAIKDQFLFHFINADGTPEQVKKQLLEEFAYQSSVDLSEEAFDMIRNVDPASIIIKQARTFLCTRLNSYATDYKDLFSTVVNMLNSEFMHIIKRQSLAGKAIIRSNNPLLENGIAVNMVLDILAERGYTTVLDVVRERVPIKVDPTVIGDVNGPRIVVRTEKIFIFNIEFPKPEIRRNQ